MLDANIKTQLKAYLEKVTQPIEIVASLDDGDKSREMQALLNDIASLSDQITLTEVRDDASASRRSRSIARAPTWACALPACPWATNSPR